MLAQASSPNIYEIMNYIYPVNSIYMTVENITEAQMSSKFGGTWVQIKDRFLLASGDTYTSGTTGGEASHTLTTGEMPYHRHAIWTTDSWSQNAVGLLHGSKAFGVAGVDQSGGNEQWTFTENGDGKQIIGYSGGSNAHNNMPPYIVVNVFKRTALYTV